MNKYCPAVLKKQFHSHTELGKHSSCHSFGCSHSIQTLHKYCAHNNRTTHNNKYRHIQTHKINTYLEVVAALSEVLDERVDGLVQVGGRGSGGLAVVRPRVRDAGRLCG